MEIWALFPDLCLRPHPAYTILLYSLRVGGVGQALKWADAYRKWSDCA